MFDQIEPFIIDNGSGTIKAGYANKENQSGPPIEFPSIIARPRHKGLGQIGAKQAAIFVGNEADKKRGLCKVSYPIEQGYIKSVDDTYLMWCEALRGVPGGMSQIKSRGLVLTEPPLNSNINRETMVEVALEKLQSKAVSLQVQGVLSLYSYGQVTGTIVEIGDGVTHTIPIFDGFCMPHAVNRVDNAGRDLTTYLQKLLMEEGVNLSSSAEFQIVRDLKEKYCFVASKAGASESKPQKHVLPDGTTITINEQQTRVPEVLFNPELVGKDQPGVHKMVADTVAKVDVDLRNDLYKNIFLSGGSSMFKGIDKRMLNEVQAIIPSQAKAGVVAKKHRSCAAFIGATMVCSLSSYDHSNYITKQELEESGKSIIARKCF